LIEYWLNLSKVNIFSWLFYFNNIYYDSCQSLVNKIRYKDKII